MKKPSVAKSKNTIADDLRKMKSGCIYRNATYTKNQGS